MKLTAEEAREVVWDESADWEHVPGTTHIIDQRRWVTVLDAVFKHKPTGKFYSLSWERGSTEYQECLPFEYDGPVLEEVELREVVTTEWVGV